MLFNHAKEGSSIFIATQMNLEDIMRSTRSQIKKKIVHDLTYTWNFKEVKLKETESRKVVGRG